MKNIRAYLTTAVVSLMLVAASAFLLADADGQTALGVPLPAPPGERCRE